MKIKLPYLLLLLCLSSNLLAQRISSTDTSTEHTLRGTFYHDRFVGRKTSNGDIFRQDKYTAAHRYLKFGTLLLVTNPKNGKQVIVKINDRCPKDKILDMTRLAASSIEIKSSTIKIRVLPEHYKELWEIQDQIKDILAEGRLLEYATHYFAGHKALVNNNGNSYTPSNDNSHLLYDIELMQGNLSNKNKLIERMPIHYQDKVGICNLANGKAQKLVLFLSLPYDDAAKILNSLKANFPHATLIESD